MSEPNVAHSSSSVEAGSSDQESTLGTLALQVAQADGHTNTAFQRSTPPLRTADSAVNIDAHALWEQERSALLSELTQVKSAAHGQIERIRHLEQALDQSLASLNELQLQLLDQQLLETQLATTEEIANIQQQAIGRLRLQLAQQQQALEAQLAEAQGQQALHELLATMEALTQSQQQELEQLRSQISVDRVEVQTYQGCLEAQLADLQTAFSAQQQRSTELESQSLSARQLVGGLEVRLDQAQLRVKELSQTLDDRYSALNQLETELRQAHTALQEQQALIDTLQHRPIHSLPLTSNPGLNSSRVEELETQLAKQTTTQAMLQHACQELEEERDRQDAKLAGLDSQITDMQEQILRQAQQASEYETAVQHWKDRCFSSQEQVLRLKELLEPLPDLPPEILERLAALEATVDPSELGSPALLTSPANRGPKIDLPDFLVRRRNYKARRS